MLGRYMSILRVLIVSFSTVCTFECPWDGWFRGSQSCYYIQEMYPMSHSDAAIWCNESEGWLASLSTEEEFNTVVSKMDGSLASEYWFGLAMMCEYSPLNITNPDCWKWRDESEMAWTKWDYLEPNDNYVELCGKIYFKDVNESRWRNGACYMKLPFVCEKSGEEIIHDLPSSDIPGVSGSSLSTLPTTVFIKRGNESSTMTAKMEPYDSQAIIIGCVVGVIAVLAILAVVVGVICYRRQKATKASTERSSSLYYETTGQHLTANPDVPAQKQQGSAYENIAVVSNPPYTQLRPKSGTLNYVEVDFPNYTHNSPKPTPKHEQVEYAEVVVDKSDSKVPMARRVSDLYAKPMKRMKNALKKKEQSSEVQSGAYDNACNKGPTV